MRARDRFFSGTGSGRRRRRLLYNFLVVLGRDEVEEGLRHLIALLCICICICDLLPLLCLLLTAGPEAVH